MADSVIDILIRLKDETRRGLRSVRQGVQEANKQFDQLDEQTTDRVEQEVKSLAERLQEVRDETEAAVNQFNKLRNAGLAVAGIGAAITAPFTLAARAAGQFQTEIAEIETLVDPAASSTQELREAVLDLSNQFGVDRGQVAAAYYQAVSRGAEAGAEANELLAESLTLARAGVTTIGAATDGLTTVLNAFNLEMSQASEVSDSLFTAVRGGATTIEELSGFLFQAAPFANVLGVSFQELNAAIAALTLSGTPTAQATTQIRAALQGLARDTPIVAEALGEYKDVAEAIEDIGLAGVLELVAEAAGDSEGELIKLIGSIEGVQAVLGLTGEQLDRFKERLEDQETAFGATADAARIVEQSFGVQLETAITRISNAFVQLGETVVPVIQPIVVAVGELAQGFSNLIEQSELVRAAIIGLAGIGVTLAALGTLITTVAVLGKGFVVLRGLLKATGLQAITAARGLATATTAVKALTFAVRLFSGPIGIAVTILGTLGLAAISAADDFDELEESVDFAIDNLDKLDSLGRLQALDTATEQVRTLTAAVAEQTRKVRELAEARNLGGILSRLFGGLERETETLDTLIEQLETASSKQEVLNEKADEIDLSKITDADFSKLTEGLEEGVRKLKALQDELKETETAADALVERVAQQINLPGTTGPEGPIEFVFEPGQAAGVRTREEEEQIRLVQERIDVQTEANQRIKAEIEAVKAARAAAKKAADEEEAEDRARLSRQERIKRAREEAALLSSQQRAALAEEQAAADELVAINENATDRLREQYERREISAEEFYTRQTQLLRESGAAQVAVLKTQLAQLTAAREAALRAATAGEASDLALARINADFDAQETVISSRITQLQRRIVGQVAEIGAEAAEAGIAGVRGAVEALLQELEVGLANINAKVQSGLITRLEGANQIQALNESVNRGLQQQLDLLLQLQRAAPSDPAIAVLIERVEQAIRKTTVSISVFEQQLRTATEGAFADFFEDVLTNLDDVGSAFDQLLRNIGASVRRLIAERLAAKLVDSIFGGGSVLGTLLGSRGGFFAAKRGGYVKAAGGGIMKLSDGGGGRVRGHGTSTSDSIPAMLSNGEYVVSAKAVRAYGVGVLEALNRRLLSIPTAPTRRLSITKPVRRRYAEGGFVGEPPSPAQIQGGADAVGQSRVSDATTPIEIKIDEGAVNMTMRDFLEREFGRILATR